MSMDENNTPTPEEENPGTHPDDGGDTYQRPARSGRRLPLSPTTIALAILVVVAALCAIFLPKLLSGSTSDPDAAALSAFIGGDGTATFVTESGGVVTLDGGVTQAVMSPDRQHIAAVYEDGSVCVLNAKGGKKTAVAQSGVAIVAVQNSGFLFTQDDGDTYSRCLWKDSAPVEIAAGVTDACVAEDSLNFLCVTAEGLSVMRETDGEAVLLQAAADALPLAISSDRGVAVWGIAGDTGITLYTASGSDAAEFGTLDTDAEDLSAWNGRVYFTGGEQNLLIVNRGSETMLSGAADSQAATIALGAESASRILCTETGFLPVSSAEEIAGVYVQLRNSDNFDIGYVSPTGGLEIVKSDVYNFFGTSGGYLYYQTIDGSLNRIPVSGATPGESEKIDSSVYTAYIGENGEVYYFTNYIYSNATLNVKIGDADPVEVTSGTIPALYSGRNGIVGYMKDYQSADSSTGTMCGSLYLYDGTGSTLVDSNVIKVQYTGYYDLTHFAYLRYDHTAAARDQAVAAYCTLLWYDGEKSVVIAEDIVY